MHAGRTSEQQPDEMSKGGGGGRKWAKSAGGINRYAAGKLCFSRASFQFSEPGRRDGKASLPLQLRRAREPARRHKDADPSLPPQVLTAAAAAAATRRQAALIKRSERISSEVKTELLRSFAPAAETDATIKKRKGA